VTASAERASRRHEGARFLVFGAANTALTYALYCGLVALLHPQLAYAIVYALGIALAYAGNSWFVFRAAPRLGTALAYPGVYMVQYLAHSAAIELLTARFGVGPRLALGLALIVATPLSLLLGRSDQVHPGFVIPRRVRHRSGLASRDQRLASSIATVHPCTARTSELVQRFP
jgi:putative flippase GtrA